MLFGNLQNTEKTSKTIILDQLVCIFHLKELSLQLCFLVAEKLIAHCSGVFNVITLKLNRVLVANVSFRLYKTFGRQLN